MIQTCTNCKATFEGEQRRRGKNTYCSYECRLQHISRGPKFEAERLKPTPWHTIDFPGCDVLWRKVKSVKPNSKKKYEHHYQFEFHLLDGRVVRTSAVYDHHMPTEDELRADVTFTVQNLMQPISETIARMF